MNESPYDIADTDETGLVVRVLSDSPSETYLDMYTECAVKDCDVIMCGDPECLCWNHEHHVGVPADFWVGVLWTWALVIVIYGGGFLILRMVWRAVFR